MGLEAGSYFLIVPVLPTGRQEFKELLDRGTHSGYSFSKSAGPWSGG